MFRAGTAPETLSPVGAVLLDQGPGSGQVAAICPGAGVSSPGRGAAHGRLCLHGHGGRSSHGAATSGPAHVSVLSRTLAVRATVTTVCDRVHHLRKKPAPLAPALWCPHPRTHGEIYSLGMSRSWNHTVRGLGGLASLTERPCLMFPPGRSVCPAVLPLRGEAQPTAQPTTQPTARTHRDLPVCPRPHARALPLCGCRGRRCCVGTLPRPGSPAHGTSPASLCPTDEPELSRPSYADASGCLTGAGGAGPPGAPRECESASSSVPVSGLATGPQWGWLWSPGEAPAPSSTCPSPWDGWLAAASLRCVALPGSGVRGLPSSVSLQWLVTRALECSAECEACQPLITTWSRAGGWVHPSTG